jgi:hypothetical protein
MNVVGLPPIASFLVIALCAAAGLAGGLAYFLALRASLALSESLKLMGLLTLLRLAVAAGGFWLAAQQGPLPLLAALAGFLMARAVVVRVVGRIVGKGSP